MFLGCTGSCPGAFTITELLWQAELKYWRRWKEAWEACLVFPVLKTTARPGENNVIKKT